MDMISNLRDVKLLEGLAKLHKKLNNSIKNSITIQEYHPISCIQKKTPLSITHLLN